LKGGWGVGSEISYFFFNFLSNSKGKGIFLGECLNHFESGCSIVVFLAEILIFFVIKVITIVMKIGQL